MKAGIWTNYYFDRPFEEKVKLYLQAGLRYGELSDEDGFSLLERGRGTGVGKEVKRFLDDSGFALPQGHLWLSVNMAVPDYRASVEKLREWIDLFAALGIQAAVIHPGSGRAGEEKEAVMERRVNAFSSLCRFAEGAGIRICVENMTGTSYTGVEELIALAEAVGSRAMGICLDTGHLNISKGDPYAFIAKAGNLLQAMHIADNEGEKDQHMMPYGRGTVNWEAVLKGLGEIGYQGFCSFEIPGESLGPLPVKQHKLVYIREIMKYMGMDS